MRDAFLEEQLELLRKLNERVAQIHDDVNQNFQFVEQQRRAAERRLESERVYRTRSNQRPQHGERRRTTDRATAAHRPGAGRHGRTRAPRKRRRTT